MELSFDLPADVLHALDVLEPYTRHSVELLDSPWPRVSDALAARLDGQPVCVTRRVVIIPDRRKIARVPSARLLHTIAFPGGLPDLSFVVRVQLWLGENMISALVRLDPPMLRGGREIAVQVDVSSDFDAFSLDGVRYWQEYRSCGSKSCWCARAYPVVGHGPYWYRRGSSIRRELVGAELPADVQHLRLAQRQAELAAPVLARFYQGDLLSDEDKRILHFLSLGF